ncbi:MAG: Spo0E like sporulation regulatory protein [Eubacterium sp.]|nr:Spo0E like sporulation regulatory protein [Eubacterium sp.]
MTKFNKKLSDEIQELREKLYIYIDEKGISDEPELRELNNKLDELIVQWFRESSN